MIYLAEDMQLVVSIYLYKAGFVGTWLQNKNGMNSTIVKNESFHSYWLCRNSNMIGIIGN